MGFYTTESVNSFFDENSVAAKAPKEFWLKALPAAVEMGFGVGEFSDDRIVVVTPDGEKKIYQGFKEKASPVVLGIVLTHAILSTKLH
tara:strand:+ start:1170 stop:1433 length:264 start_codon:yes stop_codon:yes gene_type:complete